MKLKTIGCFVLLKTAEALILISVITWIPCMIGMGVFTVFPRAELNNVFNLWSIGFCVVIGIPAIIFACYIMCIALPEMWFEVVEFIESNWKRAKELSKEE